MHKLPNESTPDFLERQKQRLEVVRAKKVGSGNPKKNPKVRRARGNMGVFIPWVLQNLRKFQSSIKPHQTINNTLFARARIAQRRGGYHSFQELNKGEK
ncbi:MAG: hypothetical protein GWP06_02875 [Actinobacteria bacterium]|nr:hypothetical protein [Actinomycetota bacterium]